MRQQIIGEVNSERLHAGHDEGDLVEGGDDVGCRAAPCRHLLNGVHHHTIHLGFSPDSNKSSSQVHEIQRGYTTLDSLTQAVAQFFASTTQGPLRQIIDITREYQEATQMLASATEENDRTFYNSVLSGLSRELISMTSACQTTLNKEE